MKKIQSLLEFLYPEVCFWCEKINKDGFCKKCQIELKKEVKFHLEKNIQNEFKHAYLCSYSGKMRSKLLEYKFKEKAYLKKGFAKLLLNSEKMCCFLKSYDIIIPVPIHRKKKGKRGYNQTELIAREISKKIENLDFQNHILEKIKENKPQSTLSRKERQENVKDVYFVKKPQKIIGKKLVLFDDIYTTGNTAAECRKMLIIAGAKQVDIVTIAKH